MNYLETKRIARPAAICLVMVGCSLVGPGQFLRLTVEAQAPQSQTNLNEQIQAFDAASTRSGSVDAKRLEHLALSVLSLATESEEADVAIEACLTLLARGPQECRNQLAERGDASIGARLKVIALASDSSGDAQQHISEITTGFTGQDWMAAVDAAQYFPASVAVPLLSRALERGDRSVKYAALVKLAQFDDSSAIASLRPWAERADSPGRLVALAAVAGAGDRKALTELEQQLPELEGVDLIVAGVALAHQKNPRGIEAVRSALKTPDDMVQLSAARALAQLGDPAGMARLQEELGNTNVYMRMAALDAIRTLNVPPSSRVWRLMSDSMAWVRVRAAQATLHSCHISAAAAQPRQ